MGDPYKPLVPGDAVTKISRTAYNELLRMLRWWKQQSGGSGSNRSSRSVVEVLVRNDTYVTAPAFSILGIDKPLISPFDERFNCQQRPAFAGVEPTVADHLGKWVALEEPIANGAIGKAVLCGFAVVRLYINGADDKRCDVIAPETLGGEKVYLGTGSTGAQILWRENAGSGKDTICWAIVRVESSAVAPKFYNNYSGTAPKYGCMAVTGVDDTALDYAIPQCDRPATPAAAEYLISAEEVDEVDPEAEPPDIGVGAYQNDGEMVLVLYETGTPALDETWIPKSGQFELVKGAAGAAWGVVVAGIYDATAKILMGRVVKASSRIRWGLVQSANPSSPFANGQATLSTLLLCYVKSCKSDGTSETGSAFTVKIPARACKDTSLFTGYCVGYQIDDAGDKIIVTDCYDDPIGTVKAWDTSAAIRVNDGWTELTGAIGRFLVGCETGETWDNPGDTGGADLNNLTAGLQDHPEQAENCLGLGDDWKLHTKLDGTGGTLNHRLSGDGTATGAGNLAPPWYAVKWIKRTS